VSAKRSESSVATLRGGGEFDVWDFVGALVPAAGRWPRHDRAGLLVLAAVPVSIAP
jgi:hypothetical protein